ncbi:MAG: hypothetical protein RL226_442 [Bacteroidota bacterium]|jgi:hypothetical protein
MKTTKQLSYIAACLFMVSCDLINPEEPLPAYLVIDDYTFTTSYPSEGSASEKFSEIWVYAGAEFLGAFEVPCVVPIIADGEVEISLRAGIKNNGIASTRKVYPFIEPYNVTVDMRPLEKDTIRPSFAYRENLVIVNAEDFEQGCIFTAESSSQSTMNRITNQLHVFEGNGCGEGLLLDGTSVLRIVSNEQQFELPANKLSWLEMNYKSNNSFAVGLYAVTSASAEKEYLMVLNNTVDETGVAQWNKIYIETTAITSGYANANYFELFFEMIRDTNVDESALYLDNIKLIHFE